MLLFNEMRFVRPDGLRGPGVVISKKYQGKDLYLAFPAAGRWYLVPHDKLVVIAAETTRWLRSSSWTSNGEYSVARPSRQMLDRLSEHALTP